MATRTGKRWGKLFAVLVLTLFLLAFEKKGIDTEQGFYSVDVQFAASTVKVGKNTLKVGINDRGSRKPLEKKLTMEAIPWMPAHEHGTSDIAQVRYLGNGQYLVEGLSFTMPGDWEVYLRIRDGGKEDTAVFHVPVAR
ncbi:MAG: FixH family protein [Nitrospirae bacterium]|nr:FixH family protein [Nitrospirota bacterium]